jgi:hypothetical protein
MPKKNKPEIGDDNTVVGPVPVHSGGSRNTFWTAADADGNARISGGTAVGYGAHADSTSVAVGARSMGGDLPQLSALLAQLQQVVGQTGDAKTERAVAEIADEIGSPSRDDSRIRRLWGAIKVAATTNEAVALVGRITPLLLAGPHH